jgi:hypothetical protein
MFGNRSLVRVVLGVSLLAPVAGVVSCGSSEPKVATANVSPGAMPANGNWRGVFYDQVFGYLHLLKSGDQVNGKWQTTAGDKWGELHGKVDGDLLSFDWVEHRVGMFGPAATSSGKGYFKYVVPKGENVDDELRGEWGLGESNAGHAWKCVKQRNMEPDPNSVMPDETTTAVEGADWDDSGKKSNNAAGTGKKDSDSVKHDKSDREEWE